MENPNKYVEIISGAVILLSTIARSWHANRSMRRNAEKTQRSVATNVESLKTEMVGEFGKLREEIATHRGADREELRTWINGSFMRSATVQARLDLAAERDYALEKRIEKLEG